MNVTPGRAAAAVLLAGLTSALAVLGAVGVVHAIEARPTVVTLPATEPATSSPSVASSGNPDLCVTLEVASLRRLLAASRSEAAWTAGLQEATLAPVRTEWACNWLDPAQRLAAVAQAMKQVGPEHAAQAWATPRSATHAATATATRTEK